MRGILVTGHYRRAAKLVRDTDPDAALVFHLPKADPLLVLGDLWGHPTVLATETYPNPIANRTVAEKRLNVTEKVEALGVITMTRSIFFLVHLSCGRFTLIRCLP